MITLVDYGLGNIEAFANTYRRLNIGVRAVQTPEELLLAEKIILPGVGAFDWAMKRLNASGMREALDEKVLKHKIPVLGVCVGMQMMADFSEEGASPGLGWVSGTVKKFDIEQLDKKTYLPHMGWNDAEPLSESCLFRDASNPRFYFLHSYYFQPNESKNRLSETTYGETYTSAIRCDNIFGTQFHPEKSHQWGTRLLKNFARL